MTAHPGTTLPVSAAPTTPVAVGVISDTHGLLRPEAIAALRGTDAIIHAGDVGKEHILTRLAAVAPIVAVVRGNVDRDPWTERLLPTDTVEIGGVLIHVLHDLKELDLNPVVAGLRVVISGHSHQPVVREENGVLYLNPGSAGPRRFRLPVTVARLEIGSHRAVSARLIELSV